MNDTATFDPTHYLNAVARLRESFDLATKPPESTSKHKDVYRASAIKNFEMVYELALKTLFRRLQIQANLPELQVQKFERVSFEELIRLGGESGYLQHPEYWPSFKLLRNKSVHTYADKIATEVLRDMPKFLVEAEFFASVLREDTA